MRVLERDARWLEAGSAVRRECLVQPGRPAKRGQQVSLHCQVIGDIFFWRVRAEVYCMAPRLLRIVAAAALAAACAGQGPPPTPACADLVSASRTGDLAAIEASLAAGVNVNMCRAGANGWTPLYHAIHKNQRWAVDALIRGGADVNQVATSVTPLMMAVGNGQLQIARRLLDAGANPRAVTDGGVSALSIAVSGGALTDMEKPILGACHTEVVRELLARDPSLRLGDNMHARFARWTARLNDCQDVMSIIARR
jgi:Ankyrin repeat